jgi:zinc D-Ala-D-Ala dipeptidase
LPCGEICEELQKEGIGVKVYGACRSYDATKLMWDIVSDEHYTANPAKGSGHNRGISIDLTLLDTRSGQELPMGTSFDYFSDSAHHNFRQLPQ